MVKSILVLLLLNVYSVLFAQTETKHLPILSQDLRIDLKMIDSGVDKQLVAVLTNTTDRLIRVRNYEGAADGSCLRMSFLDNNKGRLYDGVYIFINPNEYRRWFDIEPKQSVSFTYPIGIIRASYTRAFEIKYVEVFCILKYSTPNTGFYDIYDKTFTFSF